MEPWLSPIRRYEVPRHPGVPRVELGAHTRTLAPHRLPLGLPENVWEEGNRAHQVSVIRAGGEGMAWFGLEVATHY